MRYRDIFESPAVRAVAVMTRLTWGQRLPVSQLPVGNRRPIPLDLRE